MNGDGFTYAGAPGTLESLLALKNEIDTIGEIDGIVFRTSPLVPENELWFVQPIEGLAPPWVKKYVLSGVSGGLGDSE